MNQSTRLLAYGFIMILMMMTSLAVISYLYGDSSSNSINLVIARYLEKTSFINKLSEITHRQTHLTQSMNLPRNQSRNSELVTGLNQLTNDFRETWRHLAPFLTSGERELILSIDQLDLEITTLIRQISSLNHNPSDIEAGNILSQQLMPKLTTLVAHLSELSQSQPLELQVAMLTAGRDNEVNQTLLTLYAAFSVLISLGVAILSLWYSQKLSTQLQEINSHLEERVDERTESLLDLQKGLLEDNTELTRLALTDSLTGLSNRAHMNQILEREFSRYERHEQHFGIIMVDIDHFKAVNDNYGHDTGDQVLIQLSRSFEQATRNSDYIARWGGEEFLICCTEINQDNLLLIAENIRNKVINSVFEVVGNVTISLGCALIQAGENISQLTKRADVALYAAKNQGRNQTVVSNIADVM